MNQVVIMDDGNQLACQNVCKEFSWTLLHIDFSDVLLIALGNCDMF